MPRRSTLLAAFLFTLSLGLGTGAQADPLAEIGGEALSIEADRLRVDIEKGTAVLEGSVRATLGELEVTCSRVELTYDQAPSVKWAKGSGGVRARMKGVEARASAVEVDMARRKVALSGGVQLRRGKGWVKAERASIDLDTRRISLEDVSGSIPVEAPAR
ncbi:MAG: hypothetical protein IT376_18585 [Polyangiaceae bacterium]|nr:hypothetical protein [Polyangiaceae bacterium]